MRKKFLYLFIFLFFAFVGLIIRDIFSFYLKDYSYIFPNISVCLFVYLGFYEHQLSGLMASFLIGLLTDISVGILIGPWAFIGVLIYLLLSVYAPRIFVISRSSIIFALGLSSVISLIAYHFVVGIVSERELPSLAIMVMQIVSNIIFGPLIFIFLDRISEMRTFRFLKQNI